MHHFVVMAVVDTVKYLLHAFATDKEMAREESDSGNRCCNGTANPYRIAIILVHVHMYMCVGTIYVHVHVQI